MKNLFVLEVKQKQFLLPVLRTDISYNRQLRVIRKKIKNQVTLEQVVHFSFICKEAQNYMQPFKNQTAQSIYL